MRVIVVVVFFCMNIYINGGGGFVYIFVNLFALKKILVVVVE